VLIASYVAMFGVVKLRHRQAATRAVE
jgi:hypothetical protein